MAKAKSKQEKDKKSSGLIAWEPFGELEEWRPFGGRLQRLLREFDEQWPSGAPRDWLPALDLTEDDDEYTISVELPGTRKEDVNVEIGDGVITIHGEKKSEREEKKEKRRYVERRFGSFSRSFSLPADGDADKIAASFEDGVLTLTIPRTEQAKPKNVAIK